MRLKTLKNNNLSAAYVSCQRLVGGYGCYGTLPNGISHRKNTFDSQQTGVAENTTAPKVRLMYACIQTVLDLPHHRIFRFSSGTKTSPAQFNCNPPPPPASTLTSKRGNFRELIAFIKIAVICS